MDGLDLMNVGKDPALLCMNNGLTDWNELNNHAVVERMSCECPLKYPYVPLNDV